MNLLIYYKQIRYDKEEFWSRDAPPPSYKFDCLVQIFDCERFLLGKKSQSSKNKLFQRRSLN